MALRERLYSSFKRLETVSSKYLLPQEFYAVLLFTGIGLGALLYRGGKSLWNAIFPSNENSQYELLTKLADSTFAVFSRNSDSLYFSLPLDSGVVASSNKGALEKGVIDAAPASIILNKASSSDLEKLPGIGEVMSKRIITYRTLRGKFSTLEELMNVSGIGPKKFERMKPYLRLD